MNSQRAHCGQLNAQFISPLWNRALIEYPVNQYLHFWLIGPALFLSRAPECIDLTGEKCSSDLQTLFVLFALELRTILGQKLDLFIKRWSHQNFSVRHRWMFKLITQRGSQIYQVSKALLQMEECEAEQHLQSTNHFSKCFKFYRMSLFCMVFSM